MEKKVELEEREANGIHKSIRHLFIIPVGAPM